MFTLTIWGDSSCDEKKSLPDKLFSRITKKNNCSKSLKEAIHYKEANSSDKKAAEEMFAEICKSENEYTASCIVMGKDASIQNTTLVKTCLEATKWTPLCLLTAVSKQKNNDDIISICSKATESSAKNM